MKIVLSSNGVMADLIIEQIKLQGHVYNGLLTDTVKTDVIIDFSHPSLLEDILKKSIILNKPLIIGTTGFSENDLMKIKEASKLIPIFQSYNTSMGVYYFIEAIKNLTNNLENAHIEILETHHSKKVDAPSGTALKIKKAIDQTKNKDLDIITNRNKQVKSFEDIGIQSLRLGNVFGEHSVYFGIEDEIIEIKHTALSKKVFVKGALNIANKMKDKLPGLYDMENLEEKK